MTERSQPMGERAFDVAFSRPIAVLWIFAYGSLIFRPDFPFEERRRARAEGWVRRFHQGSPDHRGTPEHLGRVVTLVHEPGAHCDGLAYRVTAAEESRVLALLDLREQGGYERASVALVLEDGQHVVATTWIAGPTNPFWLGAEPEEAMLARIRRAKGPSGANADYVLRLRAALRELDIADPQVEALAAALSS